MTKREEDIAEIVRKLTISLPTHIKYVLQMNDGKDGIIAEECRSILQMIKNCETDLIRIKNTKYEDESK